MTAVPPRVLAALARQGIVIVKSDAIRGQGHARIFVLELDGGRRLKVRQYRRAEDAARVERCLRADAAMLPRPIARAGRWLAVEYVPGETLDRRLRGASAAERRRLIRAAGRMLARLHLVTPPPVAATSPALYPRVVTLVVNRMARTGRLAADAAARLRGLARPRAPRTGLTHGDACPENLVLTRAGRIRAIDEERVAVRPIAYDVARAICRWPLDAAEERAWLGGYAAGGGDPREFLRDRTFWIAAALATSAAYRMKYRPGALGPIVRELEILARAIPPANTKVTKGRPKVMKGETRT